MPRMPTVAILGASPKPDRISHQAVQRYRAAGWTVIPINPAGEAVDGLPALRTLDEITAPVDIVCLYVNPSIGLPLVDAIAAHKPRIVWLNPGTESPELIAALQAKGLKTVEACTLVVLAQGDPLRLA